MSDEAEDSPLPGREIIHIIPYYDLVEHYESPSCICEPVREVKDPNNENEVWVHRIIREVIQ
jgi:hypothetical protein